MQTSREICDLSNNDLRISSSVNILERGTTKLKFSTSVRYWCDIKQRNSKVRNAVAVGINIPGLSRATCTGISTCLSATLRRKSGFPSANSNPRNPPATRSFPQNSPRHRSLRCNVRKHAVLSVRIIRARTNFVA